MEYNEAFVETQEVPPVRHPSGDFKLVPEDILNKFYNKETDTVPLYNVNTNLTNAEIELVVGEFQKYDVWDQSTGKLSMPRQSKFTMRIPTNPDVPTHRVEPYSQSTEKLQFTYDQIEGMVSAGQIERCRHARCYCPILAVPKPGAAPGVWRLAHDLRAINAITIMDYFGLPDPTDMAYIMAGSFFITEFDFASGYWQIMVAKEDRYKTCFKLRDGSTWQWRVAPMGLNLSGVKFCRFVIEDVVGDLLHKTVEAFSDNVFVFTKVNCLKTHIKHCCEFLRRVEAAGMSLNAKKCHFAAQKLNIVGLTISQHGIAVNPEKLQAIANCPFPLSISAVRRLLGMANQYRKQIYGYADIVAPLTAMTKKTHPKTWTEGQVSEEARDAFAKLKEKLQSPPVLAIPDAKKPFRLRVDASDSGISAELTQKQDDVVRLVACISRALTDSERKWTVHEREALAIIWSLDKLKSYLVYSRFKICTDHRNLLWLLRLSADKGRLSRWGSLISQWSVVALPNKEAAKADEISRSLVHESGTQLVVPDWGSRQFDTSDGGTPQASDFEDLVLNIGRDGTKGSNIVRDGPVRMATSPHEESENESEDGNEPIMPSLRDILNAQKNDVHCRKVQANRAMWAGDRAPYLYDKDGLLFHRFVTAVGTQNLLAIPDKYRVKLMTLIHMTVGGHLGVAKSVTAVRKLEYWWPGMHNTARHVVRSCRGCQFAAARMNSNLAAEATRYISVPQHKWSVVSIDHVGPFPVSDGFRYLLVVMDNFSKFLVVIPTVNVDPATTARALFYEIFMTYGFPENILSDRHMSFIAPVMTELYRLWTIHKLSTAPYRPQSNGQNENSHKFIFKIVKILCEKNPLVWPACSKVGAFAWNSSSKPELHDLTPFEIQYGQQPRLPHALVSLRLPQSQAERDREPSDYASYAEYLADRFEIWISLYKEARMEAALESSMQAGLKLKDAGSVEWLNEGKLVIVYRPTSTLEGDLWTKKLLFQFTGPYRIKSVHRNAVHLANLDGTDATTQNIGHVYPYNISQDPIVEAFNRQMLTKADKEAAVALDKDMMIVVDLTDEVTGEKDYRIAKVLRKLSADEFQIHYYATNSSARDMSKRAYYPNWGWDVDGRKFEKCCKDKPNDDAYPNETSFKLNELLFEPFHLTKQNHVPKTIIEKLYLNGFACLILEIGDAANLLKRKHSDVDDEDE